MGAEIRPLPTMLDLLRDRAKNFREQGTRLLREFSGMHPVNTPGDRMRFISGHGDQSWNSLPPEGKQIQARLLPEWARLAELVRVVSLSLPDSTRKQQGHACDSVRQAVLQESTTWWKTPEEAVEGFGKAVDEILQILSDYFGGRTGTALAVPDTNALLANPDLESWRYDGISSFEIILGPTVLGELDDHKVNHRNANVRAKAEQVIRRIKEYRRRGSVHGGVSLVKGSVSLRCVAMEPDMSRTLSWFDASNADDRFLASALQIIRENMRCRVFIVTRDINMQNKAEFAGIPFLEPPLPPGQDATNA